MTQNDDLQHAKEEFLNALYQFEPSYAFGTIEAVLIAWGYLRKKVVGRTIVKHERDVAYKFMRDLDALIGDKTPRSIRKAGEIIGSSDEQDRLWAKRWHAYPYEMAMQAFVEAAYQWLDETDLRSEVTDDSPNHFDFYLKQWWYLNS